MTDVLLILALLLLVVLIVLQLLALRRRVDVDLSPLQVSLATIDRSYERSERTVREETARSRAEISESLGLLRKEVTDTSRALRDEVASALKNTADTLARTVTGMADQQVKQFEAFKADLNIATRTNTDQAEALRQTLDAQLKHLAEQATQTSTSLRQEVFVLVDSFGAGLREQLTTLAADTATRQEQAATATQEALSLVRKDGNDASKALRDEVASALKNTADTLARTVTGMADQQVKQFEAFKADLNTATKTNTDNAEALRQTLDAQLKHLAEQGTQTSTSLRQEIVVLVDSFGAGLREQLTTLAADTATRQEQAATATQEALSLVRKDGNDASKALRDEVASALKNTADTLARTVTGMADQQVKQFEAFKADLNTATRTNTDRAEALRQTLDAQLKHLAEQATQTSTSLRQEIVVLVDSFGAGLREQLTTLAADTATRQEQAATATQEALSLVRKDSNDASKALRDEVASALKNTADTLARTVTGMADQQVKQFEAFKADLNIATRTNTDQAEALRQTLDAQLKHLAEQATQTSTSLRQEIVVLVDSLGAGLREQLTTFAADTAGKLDQSATVTREALSTMTATLRGEGEMLRSSVDARLREIREDNTKQLDQMRQTVDEKLQGTLEQRLGESFKLVSERLEAVQRGLGEMQGLANGVGDLKRVLTNVSTRGTWGELRLHAILEQILSPGQYEANVACREETSERVEFCIKLPKALLPIDSKFPNESYERLQRAEQAGDLAAIESARAEIDREIFKSAQTIHDKYINPPKTTPFAILFLPTEGLYAEVVRRPALLERVQQQCRVNIAGPTTLAALLNSLQMGFRTLAIAQRSDEVWALLGAVKTEWAKYGEALDAVRVKLQQASKKVDAVAVRTRAVNRKLRTIEEMPDPDAMKLLEMGNNVAVSTDRDDDE